ncbi:hypothetical protein [Pseudonocardia adelaidensis]|uniref:Uncharacterized protein n=1 Tax=Pseudonocardia adelaidensis TaxID=648754 RepID=A0ABP9NY84_9PSEU
MSYRAGDLGPPVARDRPRHMPSRRWQLLVLLASVVVVVLAVVLAVL